MRKFKKNVAFMMVCAVILSNTPVVNATEVNSSQIITEDVTNPEDENVTNPVDVITTEASTQTTENITTEVTTELSSQEITTEVISENSEKVTETAITETTTETLELSTETVKDNMTSVNGTYEISTLSDLLAFDEWNKTETDSGSKYVYSGTENVQITLNSNITENILLATEDDNLSITINMNTKTIQGTVSIDFTSVKFSNGTFPTVPTALNQAIFTNCTFLTAATPQNITNIRNTFTSCIFGQGTYSFQNFVNMSDCELNTATIHFYGETICVNTNFISSPINTYSNNISMNHCNVSGCDIAFRSYSQCTYNITNCNITNVGIGFETNVILNLTNVTITGKEGATIAIHQGGPELHADGVTINGFQKGVSYSGFPTGSYFKNGTVNNCSDVGLDLGGTSSCVISGTQFTNCSTGIKNNGGNQLSTNIFTAYLNDNSTEVNGVLYTDCTFTNCAVGIYAGYAMITHCTFQNISGNAITSFVGTNYVGDCDITLADNAIGLLNENTGDIMY